MFDIITDLENRRCTDPSSTERLYLVFFTFNHDAW